MFCFLFFPSCLQMSRCPDRTVRCRRQKTSWTSTGTSSGAARATEPRVGRLMTGREVKMKPLVGTFRSSEPVDLILPFSDRYLRRGRRPRLFQRRRPAEHLRRRSPGLGQPDGPAARLQVLLEVFVRQPNTRARTHSDSLSIGTDSQSLASLFFFVSCLPSSDAKKKLRLALCSADSVALPIMAPATTRNGLPDHMDSEGTPSRMCRGKQLQRFCLWS